MQNSISEEERVTDELTPLMCSVVSNDTLWFDGSWSENHQGSETTFKGLISELLTGTEGVPWNTSTVGSLFELQPCSLLFTHIQYIHCAHLRHSRQSCLWR